MLAFNQDTGAALEEVPLTQDEKRYQQDDDLRNDDELDSARLSRAESPDPDDEDDLDEDDLDDDDLDLDDEDLDADVVPEDDDDLDLDNDDLEDDEDEDYNRITGQADTDLSSGVLNSYDNEDPDEIPEQEEADSEELGYPQEEEVQQNSGDDASYSEQTDVTPPRENEMPSVGRTETGFANRDQGRTTGRMVGHEPGTENGI